VLAGAKLVQQPDAVPLTALEDGSNFVPAEPLKLVDMANDLDNRIKALEPFRMSGHGDSLHDVAKFCH
jgi:hypothetical protein